MRPLACVLVCFAMGCFPYRETMRPMTDGIVVDRAGKPVGGAYVESCSATHWNAGCRYRAWQYTDSRGHFHLDARREWAMCCLGEAPLPHTIIAACGKDDTMTSVRVTGKASVTPSLVLGGEAPESWVRETCKLAFEP